MSESFFLQFRILIKTALSVIGNASHQNSLLDSGEIAGSASTTRAKSNILTSEQSIEEVQKSLENVKGVERSEKEQDDDNFPGDNHI